MSHVKEKQTNFFLALFSFYCSILKEKMVICAYKEVTRTFTEATHSATGQADLRSQCYTQLNINHFTFLLEPILFLVISTRCQHCCKVLYCSKECREKALARYHRVECKLGALLDTVRLSHFVSTT